MDKRAHWKLSAVVILLIIGITGWFVPLMPARIEVPLSGHLPLDAMFRGLGVTLWRLVPFAIVLLILKSTSPRR